MGIYLTQPHYGYCLNMNEFLILRPCTHQITGKDLDSTLKDELESVYKLPLNQNRHSGESRNPVLFKNFWMPDQVRHDGKRCF
jgi:hypothetical protein